MVFCRCGAVSSLPPRARARLQVEEQTKPPFVGGNDGLGVVMKVGPGVKNLVEGDWVVPLKPGLGTWRSLAVWKEKHVFKIPVREAQSGPRRNTSICCCCPARLLRIWP